MSVILYSWRIRNNTEVLEIWAKMLEFSGNFDFLLKKADLNLK